jgi:hypothetical protein
MVPTRSGLANREGDTGTGYKRVLRNKSRGADGFEPTDGSSTLEPTPGTRATDVSDAKSLKAAPDFKHKPFDRELLADPAGCA